MDIGSASCPTAENGTRAVKGKVRSSQDAGVTEYTGNVTILNVPPAVANDRASQQSSAAIQSPRPQLSIPDCPG
jgi:hypothetical protein